MPENDQGRRIVYEKWCDGAIAEIRKELAFQVSKKGAGCYKSSHEILGILTEEFHELIEAVRKNDPEEIKKELRQIGVGCVFALASISCKGIDWPVEGGISG